MPFFQLKCNSRAHLRVAYLHLVYEFNAVPPPDVPSPDFYLDSAPGPIWLGINTVSRNIYLFNEPYPISLAQDQLIQTVPTLTNLSYKLAGNKRLELCELPSSYDAEIYRLRLYPHRRICDVLYKLAGVGFQVEGFQIETNELGAPDFKLVLIDPLPTATHVRRTVRRLLRGDRGMFPMITRGDIQDLFGPVHVPVQANGPEVVHSWEEL